MITGWKPLCHKLPNTSTWTDGGSETANSLVQRHTTATWQGFEFWWFWQNTICAESRVCTGTESAVSGFGPEPPAPTAAPLRHEKRNILGYLSEIGPCVRQTATAVNFICVLLFISMRALISFGLMLSVINHKTVSHVRKFPLGEFLFFCLFRSILRGAASHWQRHKHGSDVQHGFGEGNWICGYNRDAAELNSWPF